MKKTFKTAIALLLSVLMVLAGIQAVGFATFADEPEEPVEEVTVPEYNGFLYEAGEGTATIIGVNGLSGDVVIPDVIEDGDNELEVNKIAVGAFRGALDITSITVPASVTDITEGALNTTSVAEDTYKVKAGSLKEIKVDEGNGVYAAKDGILYDVDFSVLYQYPVGDGVTSFTVPEGVTAIGAWAFAGAVKLAEITFTDDVVSIGGAAFLGCKKLKSVELPKELDSVSDLTFCRSGLRSIDLPATVSAIGAGAFSNCASLSKVNFAEGSECTAIRDAAFNGCSALTKIDIPDNVKEIGNAAFLSCGLLTKVSFGEDSTLKTIGSYAFSRCGLIGSFALPDSVVSIGECAFLGDFTLRLKIGEGSALNDLGNQAFVGCFLMFSIDLPIMGADMEEGFVPGTLAARPFSASGILVIKYAGTVEQFGILAVATDIPLFATVRCTDGTVSGFDKPVDKTKALFKDIGDIIKLIFTRGKEKAPESIIYDV